MEIIVVCFVEKDYIKQHIGIMLGLAHDFVLYFCIYMVGHYCILNAEK